MKKIAIMMVLAGIFSVNLSKADNECTRNCNAEGKSKLTHNKTFSTIGKGADRGAYYVTHNKFTKVTKINNGNVNHTSIKY